GAGALVDHARDAAVHGAARARAVAGLRGAAAVHVAGADRAHRIAGGLAALGVGRAGGRGAGGQLVAGEVGGRGIRAHPHAGAAFPDGGAGADQTLARLGGSRDRRLDAAGLPAVGSPGGARVTILDGAAVG